jgi:hypothetical protein
VKGAAAARSNLHSVGRRIAVVVITTVAMTACRGHVAESVHHPATVVRLAARAALAARTATLHGSMSVDGKPIVSLSGKVDFAHRETDITTTSPSGDSFESRFVDGWSYMAVDPNVARPPEVRLGTGWIAYAGRGPHQLPIGSRTTPPMFPLQALEDLSHKAVASARVTTAHAGGPTTIRVRLRSASPSTYRVVLDTRHRIVSVTVIDTSGQGIELRYTLGARFGRIAVPPAGEVQRLSPGEELYSTTSATA